MELERGQAIKPVGSYGRSTGTHAARYAINVTLVETHAPENTGAHRTSKLIEEVNHGLMMITLRTSGQDVFHASWIDAVCASQLAGELIKRSVFT